MGIESVSAFRGTFGLGATGSVYASPPTSYFRANADAIVLTNRKPVQAPAAERLRRVLGMLSSLEVQVLRPT